MLTKPCGFPEWLVRNPRVEYMACPALGIDVRAPRFAWMIDGSKAYTGTLCEPSTQQWRCVCSTHAVITIQ